VATHRIPVLSEAALDVGIPLSTVGAQITAATAPSIGTQLCYVFNDGGVDKGIYFSFSIPKNFVGSPVLVVRGILDGAPGSTDVLGLAARKRAVANNEAADGTFDAEQTGSQTVGSSGANYADEDEIEITINLTAGDYAVDDTVYEYLYIDASVTTYAGNFLLKDILFQYADV
jgi:hypothetical protein